MISAISTKILVVENDDHDLLQTLDALHRLGVERVEIKETPESALQSLHRAQAGNTPFDMVLIGASAVRLAPQVRQLQNPQQPTPVLVMQSNSESGLNSLYGYEFRKNGTIDDIVARDDESGFIDTLDSWLRTYVQNLPSVANY